MTTNDGPESSRPMKTALFDYGAGNLHSLGKALEGGGAEVRITTDWDEALSAEILVLPGVGSFGAAVRALGDHGDAVREALRNGLPCLGICLGMQLFFEESEEGEGRGIGLIEGRVREMEARRVPQMGWNDVEVRADPLFEGVDELVAYYANSFVCEPEDDAVAIAWSEYDGQRFVAGVRAGATWGLQFHPEKSSDKGLRVIHNFLHLARDSRDGADGSEVSTLEDGDSAGAGTEPGGGETP